MELDERKAAVLMTVLPEPAFPELRQLDTAEEERVRVSSWMPSLHLAPVCEKITALTTNGRHPRRWQVAQGLIHYGFNKSSLRPHTLVA